MIWNDILIDRRLDDPEIARALAKVFGAEARGVLVRRYADEFPDPSGCRVVAIATGLGGDYPMLLSIYDYPNGADSPPPIEGSRLLSAALGADCLISDDEGDPYEMLRVSPIGKVEAVILDPVRLDELGEYQVVGLATPRPVAIDRRAGLPLR